MAGAPAAVAASAPAGLSRGVADITTVLAGGGSAAGTGMVQPSSGIVVTNNHVIAGAIRIVVTDVTTGTRRRATVIGYDTADDVAVLRLAGHPVLPGVSLGDSSTVALGDAVTAVGNAGGVGGTPSAASGVVTALHRSITVGDASGDSEEHLSGLIVTDADLQPGDSGGPLLDAAGQVVGMDTAASVVAGPRTVAARGGFAIRIDRVSAIARRILAGRGSATVHIGPTAQLGVYTVPASGDPGARGVAGAAVAQVVDGSAAAGAGLTSGDTIVAFGGRRVGSPAGLSAAVLVHHPGDTVRVVWVTPEGGRDAAVVRLGRGAPA